MARCTAPCRMVARPIASVSELTNGVGSRIAVPSAWGGRASERDAGADVRSSATSPETLACEAGHGESRGKVVTSKQFGIRLAGKEGKRPGSRSCVQHRKIDGPAGRPCGREKRWFALEVCRRHGARDRADGVCAWVGDVPVRPRSLDSVGRRRGRRRRSVTGGIKNCRRNRCGCLRDRVSLLVSTMVVRFVPNGDRLDATLPRRRAHFQAVGA